MQHNTNNHKETLGTKHPHPNNNNNNNKTPTGPPKIP